MRLLLFGISLAGFVLLDVVMILALCNMIGWTSMGWVSMVAMLGAAVGGMAIGLMGLNWFEKGTHQG